MKKKSGKLEAVPPADSGSSLPALDSPPQTPSAGSAGYRRVIRALRLEHELKARAEKAEAEVERLRTVLRKIADTESPGGYLREIRGGNAALAQAALAEAHQPANPPVQYDSSFDDPEDCE